MRKLTLTALVVSFLACFITLEVTGCKTMPTSPDSFYQAVVTCTKDNSQNAQAGSAVLRCLTGAVAGDYTACLAGLVTGGYWTVEEVACVVRQYATESAQRINAGSPSAADSDVLKNANAWIKSQGIQYR